MSTIDTIYQEAKALPEGLQKEILEFIKALQASNATSQQPQTGLRPYGLCKGEFKVPDDFNDPLPPEILKDFYGE
jgi:hypothetical protein